MSKISNFLHNFFNLDFHKLLMKCNTLETEKEVLENTIKDELYKEFMAKLGEPIEMKRLREENKRVRKQNKTLKQMIKEESINGGSKKA